MISTISRNYVCYNMVITTVHVKNLNKTLSTRTPQAVFVEKSIEEPVIVMHEQDDVDIIGPPDPVSNLRPYIRKRLLNETNLQHKLRTYQDATQAWNHEFWCKHNTRFVKERQEYIDAHQVKGLEKRQITADEMSEFYKKFLDENWHTHLKYNGEWYKRNFTLLYLALRVSLEKTLHHLHIRYHNR